MRWWLLKKKKQEAWIIIYMKHWRSFQVYLEGILNILIMSFQKENVPYVYKKPLVCYVECASSSYWSLSIRLLC